MSPLSPSSSLMSSRVGCALFYWQVFELKSFCLLVLTLYDLLGQLGQSMQKVCRLSQSMQKVCRLCTVGQLGQTKYAESAGIVLWTGWVRQHAESVQALCCRPAESEHAESVQALCCRPAESDRACRKCAGFVLWAS